MNDITECDCDNVEWGDDRRMEWMIWGIVHHSIHSCSAAVHSFLFEVSFFYSSSSFLFFSISTWIRGSRIIYWELWARRVQQSSETNTYHHHHYHHNCVFLTYTASLTDLIQLNLPMYTYTAICYCLGYSDWVDYPSIVVLVTE